jgi:hypothetical protein
LATTFAGIRFRTTSAIRIRGGTGILTGRSIRVAAVTAVVGTMVVIVRRVVVVLGLAAAMGGGRRCRMAITKRGVG